MSKLYSIKCPNCGSPLTLLGGGRVQSITCDYCKSLIDLNDNYKILSNFKNVVAPKVPFQIGMSGEIEGREWTIIGWIVYRSKDDLDDKWSEFLLFSPLYGYSWLVYESGVISFSKRVRDFDLRKWDRVTQTVFYRKGHYLLDDEYYDSVIDFVQGELTWVAKKDDKIRCWDYKGGDREILNIEQSSKEIEVYRTQRLKAEKIYESFGVAKEQQVIQEKTFSEKLEEKKPHSFYGIVALFIIIIITMFASLSTNTLLSEKINSNTERLFRVTNSAFMTQIEIKSSSSKTMDSYSISIEQHNKRLFYIDKSGVYFLKDKRKEPWKQWDIGANIYLKLPTGQYLLRVRKDSSTTNSITINIYDRVIRLSYIIPLFIAMIFFFFYSYFTKILTNLFEFIAIAFALVIAMIVSSIADISPLLTIGVVIILLIYLKTDKG